MTTLVGREPTVPTWTFGERLAKARREAGLTQAQMAALLGTSSVANWEVGTAQPRHFLETIHRWAEITNVPVTWLLDETHRCEAVPSPPETALSFPRRPHLGAVR